MSHKVEQTGNHTAGTGIRVLNAGSSSLKFAVFDIDAGELKRKCHGQAEGIGTQPQFSIGGRHHDAASIGAACKDHAGALQYILAALAVEGINAGTFAGVGHRIVHGGPTFTHPIRLEASNLAALDDLRALAPLHNTFGLEAVHAMLNLAPDIPQIACFDTAFHATQPDVAKRFALPVAYHEAGYRRYGFHGINYQHVIAELPKISGIPLPRRVLVFHLGNGSSICAIKDGLSVATTMGYSTLDGLVMGTRSGSIDPGVLIALMRDKSMSITELETLLYRKSGLLGLSGASSDMRMLLESTEPAFQQAVQHFCYWAARHAASLLPAMGGLDAIVFTGGIGANAARVRASIIAQLAWLGLALEEHANVHNEPLISARSSVAPIWIILADEERAIARHTYDLLRTVA